MSFIWQYSSTTVDAINDIDYPVLAICGGSGSGKSTLTQRILADLNHLYVMPNCTTRPQRPSDHPGNFIYFEPQGFTELVNSGAFFFHRLGLEPRYGYRSLDINQAILRKALPLFMFRHSGLEAMVDIVNNLHVIFVESNPREAYNHSKDTFTHLTTQDIKETNNRIKRVLTTHEIPYIHIYNNYTERCFKDKKTYSFVREAIRACTETM